MNNLQLRDNRPVSGGRNGTNVLVSVSGIYLVDNWKKPYSVGDQVEHKLFGKGIILAIEGVEDGAKLTIEFKGKVSKMIIAKYVKPA